MTQESSAAAKEAAPFEYWPPEVVDEIVRRRGLHKGKCVLERRQGPIAVKGHGGGLLRLVGVDDGEPTKELDGTTCPDLDDSLICPPFCRRPRTS